MLQKDHEECDLGTEDNEEDGNACTKSCKLDGKVVFVTSETYNGVDGADAKCNAHALEAGVANAGKFMAWLSTADHSPASRMTHYAGRYVLLDGGAVVAESWEDLTYGMLAGAINIDETGAEKSGEVWTGTYAMSDEGGQHGLVPAKNAEWTEKDAMGCSYFAYLICVEQ